MIYSTFNFGLESYSFTSTINNLKHKPNFVHSQKNLTRCYFHLIFKTFNRLVLLKCSHWVANYVVLQENVHDNVTVQTPQLLKIALCTFVA